ncbi:hypothetical protein FS827_19640 [Agrobacterium vitis]|uniref:Uncharacterized protein n=1 Tax=Agrobacterium vitis TaxID=373 RepID=A0AAE2UU79_AGRVI|nr:MULTISPECIES: hypothetical protein [Rhizobium/Agrobacterium group]MBF2715081.1 hypothetical protein [Agrobacterium vitis]MCF1463522.1 hypothetical protein [Allorhizobium ampelinum]MCF1470764.1 hypothetical protein [Allorhizobium ampelinum]
MSVLAKLWTWTGYAFVPLAITWVFYARGGTDGTPVALGVLVSRGYWGLLLTLLVTGLLLWTVTLYVRAAKARGSRILIPPNTTFETGGQRNRLVSWGTAIIFAAVMIAALAVFSIRYGDSRIYGWDDRTPLADGFWESRTIADARRCPNGPCFAISERLDSSGKPLSGVNEYIPIITDAAIVVAALPALACLAFHLYGIARLIRSRLRRR